MKHKVIEKVGDELVDYISLSGVRHSTAVTNETFSVLSTVNKPPSGLSKLVIGNWMTLDEKVSPTVMD